MQWNSETEAAWLATANSELRSEVLALKQEVERLRDEMSTMHRTVVHDCCVQVQSERGEAERLRAEVSMLRAVMAALDAFHRPIYDDDIDSLTSGDRFCAVDDEAWPCSTHLLLHPKETRDA